MAIEVQGMAPLLQVFDMPTSIAFYRDVLGFEVASTSNPGGERFGWALLKLNGVELMLNTAYEEDARLLIRRRRLLKHHFESKFVSIEGDGPMHAIDDKER